MKRGAERARPGRKVGAVVAGLAAALLARTAAGAPPDDLVPEGRYKGEPLAKAARNPLPDFVIVPIQNNTNLDYGPVSGLQDGLNIQPLISFRIAPDWNIVTRTIIPFIFDPSIDNVRAAGLGDIQFTPYLSPSALSVWTWGIGPVVQFPTHGDPALGNDNLGLGPAIAGFRIKKGDPWVLGLLASTAWSLGNAPAARPYAAGSFQPMVSYHFTEDFYLASSPIIKANWLAPPEHRLLLPLGGGIGHVFHFGKTPINLELSGYYNVARRDYDADWQLRVQLQFLFPRPL